MLSQKNEDEIGLSSQDKKGRRGYGAMILDELQKIYTKIFLRNRRFYFDPLISLPFLR